MRSIPYEKTKVFTFQTLVSECFMEHYYCKETPLVFMSNADMAGTIPSETFHQQLSLKLMTEDCKLLLAQVIHVLCREKNSRISSRKSLFYSLSNLPLTIKCQQDVLKFSRYYSSARYWQNSGKNVTRP